MREFGREQRVGDAILRELSVLVRNMRDPRVGVCCVTEVKVTRDLAYAEVFVALVGECSADEKSDLVASLTHAKGFLRSQLARLIRLRTVPELRFTYDDLGERGDEMSQLIRAAVAEDEQRNSQEASEANSPAQSVERSERPEQEEKQ